MKTEDNLSVDNDKKQKVNGVEMVKGSIAAIVGESEVDVTTSCII